MTHPEQILIRAQAGMAEALALAAKQRGTSVAGYVRILLNEALEEAGLPVPFSPPPMRRGRKPRPAAHC